MVLTEIGQSRNFLNMKGGVGEGGGGEGGRAVGNQDICCFHCLFFFLLMNTFSNRQ